MEVVAVPVHKLHFVSTLNLSLDTLAELPHREHFVCK